MTDHSELMDSVYRYQRLIYDVTRKYYLLGRDHLISEMRVEPGQTVLEIACGTGRNLRKIHRHAPQARLFGLDISEQMLQTARQKLGATAVLAQGDACAFDPEALFGTKTFDHIIFSYSLSMIPDWENALSEATRHLAPGGTLHVVDFGDQSRLPGWFKRGLRAWLARFHVSPRDQLDSALEMIKQNKGASVDQAALFLGYAYYGRLDTSGAK